MILFKINVCLNFFSWFGIPNSLAYSAAIHKATANIATWYEYNPGSGSIVRCASSPFVVFALVACCLLAGFLHSFVCFCQGKNFSEKRSAKRKKNQDKIKRRLESERLALNRLLTTSCFVI